MTGRAGPARRAGEAGAGGGGRQRGWYAYAITTGDTPLPGESVQGVDGGGLRAVDAGPLRAIVSEVDAAVLADEALEAERGEPARLERLVCDHDAVLGGLAASAPVVPLRFGTILATEGDIRDLLARHREGLERTLARLAGAAEWGVKGSWSPAALRAHAIYTAPEGELPGDGGPSAGGGTSYLLGKRRDQSIARAAQRLRDTVLAACHQRLAAQARQAVLLPLRSAPTPGGDRPLVLNASYLVDRAGCESFRSALVGLSAAHARAGLALQLTGPWPPYSFVGPDALGEGSQ